MSPALHNSAAIAAQSIQDTHREINDVSVRASVAFRHGTCYAYTDAHHLLHVSCIVIASTRVHVDRAFFC